MPSKTKTRAPLTPGGPEWWTAKNTARWARQQWGDPTAQGPAQRIWSGGIDYHVAPPRSRAALIRPLNPKLMAKWRKADPRPTPTTFYDGVVDVKRVHLPLPY